jgi:hypothetical protein
MELRKAIHRAARRAADAGVTATKKEISAETTMKSTAIGERVKKYVYGSPVTDFAIGVKISDTARPLSEFAFWPKKPKPNTSPIVEIYKGENRNLAMARLFRKCLLAMLEYSTALAKSACRLEKSPALQ